MIEVKSGGDPFKGCINNCLNYNLKPLMDIVEKRKKILQKNIQCEHCIILKV